MRVFNATIQDEYGNIQPGAIVEVRDEDTGALLVLRRVDNTLLGNPFTVGVDGLAQFRVNTDHYAMVQATLIDGTTQTWRYVDLWEFEDIVDDIAAIIAGTQQVGDSLLHDGAARSTDGTMAGNSDLNIPTERAVVTYVGAQIAANVLPPGSIIAYGNDSVPAGFVSCDASALNRVTYAALFAAIGTTWGVGDGVTTFNVPDLQGAFLRGKGSHGSETMADGNPFAGPAVGSYENDMGQQITGTSNGIWGFNCVSSGAITVTYDDEPGDPDNRPGSSTNSTNSVNFDSADSTNSRQDGDEFRPFNAGVKYIIKT